MHHMNPPTPPGEKKAPTYRGVSSITTLITANLSEHKLDASLRVHEADRVAKTAN